MRTDRKAWNPLPKTYTSTHRKTFLHSTRVREEWVLPAAQDCLWQIPEPVRIWSRKIDRLTLPNIGRPPEDVEDSYQKDDGQRCEVQTREEATVYVKELDLFVTVMLLDENTRSYFCSEAQRGSWVDLSLDRRSKTTSNQKGQENCLQYINRHS